MVQAAVYDAPGPPSVFRLTDLPDPHPAPGEVLIAVEAISIEGGDLIHRRSVAPPGSAHVVGYQAAGRVIAVGEDADSGWIGRRVVLFNWSGSHADRMVAPIAFAFPVPQGLDLRQAVAVPVAFGTADDALFEFGRLQPEETVLILGGSGGVGIAAVQLAARAGARVIVTTSGAGKADRLRALGAAHAIDRQTQDIAREVDRATGGEGVDLLVDLVGGPQLRTLTPSVRRRGRIVMIGAASGEYPVLGFADLVERSLTATGVAFGQEMHTHRVHAMIADHLAAVREGRLTVLIDRHFPLAEAAAAHAHAEGGGGLGRVLLIPDQDHRDAKLQNQESVMSRETEDTVPFTIFRGGNGKAMTIGDLGEMTTVIGDGLARMDAAGVEDGRDVRVIFDIPGFSLTHAWFKSGFPLPLHSHRHHCLYYITAGSLRIGTETLFRGDGFFVPGETPYTYVPGEEGVELVEFRHEDCDDVQITAKAQAYWDRAVAKVVDRRDAWSREGRPGSSHRE